MKVDISKMQIDPFAFAGSAGKMTVNELNGSANLNISMILSTKDEVVLEVPITFVYAPTIVIDWSEILSSVCSALEEYDDVLFCEIEITNYRDTEKYNFPLLRGKMDNETFRKAAQGGCLITSRPQIYRASEASSALVYCDFNWSKGVAIRGEFHYRHCGPKVYDLTPFILDSRMFSKVSLGLKEIQDVLKLIYDDFDLLENYGLEYYDIYTEYGEGLVSDRLRIIPEDSPCSEFRFCGSYGTLETIFASPREKIKSDVSSETFVRENDEKETSILSMQIHQSYSGYVDNQDLVRYWNEFFASSTKYIVKNGQEHRIIVESVESERMDGELAAYTFKWHYADRLDNPDLTVKRMKLNE